MIKIETPSNHQNQIKLKQIDKIADLVFVFLKLKGDCLVELDFVSKEQIKDLNSKHRGIDKPTDVLSFANIDGKIKKFDQKNYPFCFDDGLVNVGSIVICDEVAAQNASEYGQSLQAEINYLFLHGLLHIFGFDHIKDDERAAMRAVERHILALFSGENNNSEEEKKSKGEKMEESKQKDDKKKEEGKAKEVEKVSGKATLKQEEDKTQSKKRCGFVAVLGRPNAGKSSLINALIGQKVLIVSPKPQTTRERINGILTEGDDQIVFVDTPGIHEAKTALGEAMGKSIRGAAAGADAVVVVLDTTKQIDHRDAKLIRRYAQSSPVYVVLNKSDITGFETIYPLLSALSDLIKIETLDEKLDTADEFLFENSDNNSDKDAGILDGKEKKSGDKESDKKEFLNKNQSLNAQKNYKNLAKQDCGVREIIPLSAKTGLNVDVLKKFLLTHLKQGEWFYDGDIVSDKSVKFLSAEIIREKTLWLLQDEIPHGVAVVIQLFEDDGGLTRIEADIVCEKNSHKQIIIGQNGAMAREIGQKARIDIEKMLGKKVFLKLFVKVRENWRNRPSTIKDMGY